MRIQIASDLHLEFWGHDWRRPIVALGAGADVLLLPGDIFTWKTFNKDEIAEIFSMFSDKAKHVFYLEGNHEYYGMRAPELHARIRDTNLGSNVHVLHDEIVEIEGQRFLGGTLWFPCRPEDAPNERYLSDFSVIKDFKPWVYERYQTTRDFLQREVREKDVVLTHHLPSARSVHREYKGSPLNAFFMVSMEDIIEKQKPVLWVHGHTHKPCDYRLFDTRVVCNPMGYPMEPSVGYSTSKIVEI